MEFPTTNSDIEMDPNNGTHGMLPAEGGTAKMSKILAVEIKGTLSGFSAMGLGAATWKPIDGKHVNIFGVEDGFTSMGKGAGLDSSGMMASGQGDQGTGGSAPLHNDFDSAMTALKNATITKATVLQSYNTFPVPLGVTINCLPCNEVCDTGDKYAFTTIPHSSVNVPVKLYEAGQCQTQAAEWRRNYPKFNPTNLETQDVLHVPDSRYVFVNENHPVVSLLRVNKNLLGIDLDEIPKMDNQWYKITAPLMQTSCDILRSKVLSRIATQDLTSLQIQLHRIGGVDWAHCTAMDTMMTFKPNPTWSAQEYKVHQRAHEKDFTEKPATFMARIQIEYEIPK